MLIFSQHAFSQTYFIMVKDGAGLWSYVNLKGEVINTTKFSKCYPFSDHRAVVYEGSSLQCYIINEKGEKVESEIRNFIIDDEYYESGVAPFSGGLMAIKNKKWGYMDTTGKLIIPLKYDQVSSFDNGYAIVKSGKKYIVITKTGKEILVTAPDVKEIKHFSGGLAPFQSAVTNQFGFIDTTGNVLIPATFKSVGYFINELAWAKTSDGKVGFINSKGEWIIAPKFDYAKDFDPESGLARIKMSGQWAYTNKSGRLLNVATDLFGDFHNGLAKGELRDKAGFFDKGGNWVITPQFEEANSFTNGYTTVKKGGKWGVIDKEGKWIIQPTFYFVKVM